MQIKEIATWNPRPQGRSSTCCNHLNQTGDSIYFMDHSEFIVGQWKKILSKGNKKEIKRFDFGSIKRTLRSHLKTIMEG